MLKLILISALIFVAQATELFIDVLIGKEKGFATFNSDIDGEICLDESNFLLHGTNA
jgi:hypothetical protein